MPDPAHQLAVFLPGNRTDFRPGERLQVTVLWALERTPGPIEVRLFWMTRGKGTEDLRVVSTESIQAGAAAGEAACAFVLPAAPWSFSGRLISLVWAAEAVVPALDLAASCEFVMAPDGIEIHLKSLAPPGGGAQP